MTLFRLALIGAASLTAPLASPAAAETREAYLERLKVVCEVECLKPRDFRRAARKQRDGEAGELAVMMDVLYVRRAGEKYQLMSADLERSNLETLAILGSAGIDVSGRTAGEGEGAPDKVTPTLASLKSRLLNRRVVVRGNFRLTPVWNGGRLDYRRKQVTLELDNSDDMVVLPRYDEDGEPIADDIPWLEDKAAKNG